MFTLIANTRRTSVSGNETKQTKRELWSKHLPELKTNLRYAKPFFPLTLQSISATISYFCFTLTLPCSWTEHTPLWLAGVQLSAFAYPPRFARPSKSYLCLLPGSQTLCSSTKSVSYIGQRLTRRREGFMST